MHDLSERYPVWLCDIWGVLHDGIAGCHDAADALTRHRAAGGTVILLTNAPRPAAGIARQLDRLGIGPQAYDAIISSGDVTRDLVAKHRGGKVHHIGPARDLGVFENLGVTLASLDEAAVVVCTGLFDDEIETPADYDETLARMRARDLTMICANPDRLVRRGAHLIYCAGALAARYAATGSEVLMAGKPFRPVYHLALERAKRVRGGAVAPEQVLAIGDGPETDIRGAADFGIDAVLVAGGVSESAASLAEIERSVRRAVPEARIVRTIRSLAWTVG